MTEMLRDGDLVGDRLLLGLAAVQLHAVRSEVRWRDAARAAVGAAPGILGSTTVLDGERLSLPGGHVGWLRRVIKADLPRYERPCHRLEGPGSGCMARTPRKERCGRPIGTGPSFWEPDPRTGEQFPRQFCYRHRAAGEALWREIRARPPAPAPAANRGGVLARYIDSDWERLYQWVDENWMMPPSGPPRPRPRLRVLVTDEVDYLPEPHARQPALVLAERSGR
ncbi:hypothetical protein [Actinomadura nitritigenes]|uniref:hypothetical protein n=1 Tax=Actinomadura nitritigenes TaxID=134602 RepID=UPI003D8CB2B3